MAYQTGVSSSVGDLLNSLRAFAVSQGFSDSSNWSVGAQTAFALTKNGIKFHFQYDANVLYMNTATDSNGSGAINAQANAASVNCRVWQIVGPHVGFHFFSDGMRIHAVVELVTDVFQHLSFGFIDKAEGSGWVGGAYVTGNAWGGNVNGNPPVDVMNNGHCRIFDGIGNANMVSGFRGPGHVRVDWIGQKVGYMVQGNSDEISSGSTAPCSPWRLDVDLTNDSPNSYNSRAVIVPVRFNVGNTYNAITSLLELGVVPNAASLNIAQLNPKDTVQTDWMVFPLCQKNGPGAIYVNSRDYGMAYRK